MSKKSTVKITYLGFRFYLEYPQEQQIERLLIFSLQDDQRLMEGIFFLLLAENLRELGM